MIYNSALKNANVKVWDKYKKQSTTGKECVAFSHDLTTEQGLPNQFDPCDVFYSEIPWQHGYTKFYERAELKANSSYSNFIESLKYVVSLMDRPFLLTGGKGLAKRIPEADEVRDISMVHCDAWLYSYNCKIPQDITTTLDLLDYLAEAYSCLGNFTCGYGHSGFKFLENGKRFVMSDINQYCIGYIDEQLNG